MWSRTNYRKHISKGMKCGRRRQNPLKSTSNTLLVICCPRIICTFRSVCKSLINNIKKVNKTQSTQIRSVRTDHIPTQKRIRIIKIASRYSGKTLKVLREKCLIYPNKELKELSLTMMFWILAPCKFAYPKIKGSKNPRDSTHTQYVMKMCNDIVSLFFLCYHKYRTLSSQNI